MYRTKSYGISQFDNPKDDFEKEMRELEKIFEREFNCKSPIKPVFEPTDDMFEREDEIDMPSGAISVEVKQKTVTNSRGRLILIIHKTITYENGEKKTFKITNIFNIIEWIFFVKNFFIIIKLIILSVLISRNS